MRHALVSVVAVVVMTFVMVFGAMMLKPTPPAAAEPVVNCQLVVGNPARVICTAAGVQVLNTVVQLPTVTLPPVTLPPATVPGPTRTVTVPTRVPGPTVTVPGPGTTATVTLPPKPGRTVTQTVRPDGKPIPRATTTATQTATVTEAVTPTVSPSGQTDPERGTIDEDGGFFSPKIDLDDDRITAGEAGIGLLSVLALIAAGVLSMYGGYRLGRQSSTDEDTAFMRDVLDGVPSKTTNGE